MSRVNTQEEAITSQEASLLLSPLDSSASGASS